MNRSAFVAACMLAAAGAVHTQPTAADSGWVPLWNGKDFAGLYVFATGKGIVESAAQSDYSVDAGVIRVKGSPGGYLGTSKQYSHYRVRVEYQWPIGTAANANSGLLIHLDSAAVFSGSYTSGGRPRSIEVNCRRDNNYPWSLWSARSLGPYLTSTVTALPAADAQGQYKPAGLAWTDDPWGEGNHRVLSGDAQPNPERPLGQWNLGEAILRGDSGTFILNGQVRTRAWNFQNRVNAGAAQPRIACTRGNIGLQSEGHAIAFRNFAIQELDPVTGGPLHARRGCTDPDSRRYDSRAVVDDGSCTATRIASRPGAISAPAVRRTYRDAVGRVPGGRAASPRFPASPGTP